MESYKKLIGKKIQKRRIEMGFVNQDLLATKLKTDQAQISRWEAGVNVPEGAYKKALQKVLNVKPMFFEEIETESDPIPLLFMSAVTKLASLNEAQLRRVLLFISDIGRGSTSTSSAKKTAV